MAGGNYKEKGRLSLAWVSFGLALVGGAAIAVTFVGGILKAVLGIFPVWVAAGLLVGAIVLIIRDVWLDSEPNFMALYCGMAVPSLAAAVPGKFGDSVSNWAGQVLAQADKIAGTWFGTVGPMGVAAVCVLVSLLLGQRMVTRSPSGGAGRR